MHIYIKNKLLTYGDYRIKCAIGKRGIAIKRKEGDLITPVGEFKIKSILYRKDNIYDIILILNFNTNPVIKNKGSAIFIHITTKNYNNTKGCVAIKKRELLKMIKSIKKNTKIIIM